MCVPNHPRVVLQKLPCSLKSTQGNFAVETTLQVWSPLKLPKERASVWNPTGSMSFLKLPHKEGFLFKSLTDGFSFLNQHQGVFQLWNPSQKVFKCKTTPRRDQSDTMHGNCITLEVVLTFFSSHIAEIIDCQLSKECIIMPNFY